MNTQMDGVPARQWLAGQWLADGSLEAVQEINTQCLEYLAADPVWEGLDAMARSRLAASPYLLVDAGFDAEQRWQGLAQRGVQDLPTACSEAAFTGPGAADFIRRVLVLGWHMARANRQLARVVLGMTPACAASIATLRLRDLDWLAAARPGWVRLRWEHQPRIWRHLLHAAMLPDQQRLTQASLRGLQMLASDVVLAPVAARAMAR